MTPASPGTPGTRGLTLALYWGSLALGLLLPWAIQIWVEVVNHHRPLMAFFDGLYLRLFGPETGLLLLSLLGVAPFLVYAVFALLHLGTAPRQGGLVVRRRRLALLVSLAAMLAVTTWGHYSILTARGSTASIGFIFLPFYVLLAMPLGYGIGRGAAAWRYR
jgi:hypothetical protein